MAPPIRIKISPTILSGSLPGIAGKALWTALAEADDSSGTGPGITRYLQRVFLSLGFFGIL